MRVCLTLHLYEKLVYSMLPIGDFVCADEGSPYKHSCTVLRADCGSVQPISVPVVVGVPILVSVHPKLETSKMKMWLA